MTSVAKMTDSAGLEYKAMKSLLRDSTELGAIHAESKKKLRLRLALTDEV